MIVKIEIDCETAGELELHLLTVIETVKSKSKGNKDFDFEFGERFSDNNCYGTHDVIIEPEN